MTNRWLYLASDYQACVHDTRALSIRHGFIWYAGTRTPSPAAGDRLLLAFKRAGCITPLALFETRAPAEAAGPAFGTCVGVLPEERFEDFRRARPGQKNGSGYTMLMNSGRRALAVSCLEPFDPEWAKSEAPHAFPPNLSFGLSQAGKKSQYLVPFDVALLADPMLDARFHP